MPDLTTHFEFEFDDRLSAALAGEAARLNLSPDEIVRRAVAAWVAEMADDNMPLIADSELGQA